VGRRLTVRLGGRKRTKTTGENGGFNMSLRAGHLGSYPVRDGVDDDDQALGRSRRTRAFAYRRAYASWYGPGLYGNRLACGGTLKPSTLGVAHKRLPCGSKVRLRYGGRGIVVRVIDRGPFVAGREFDLTAATKRRLRFGSTGTIWTTR
jgi:rare lipoprotein A (peptidoglycan hydrolase)